MKNVFYPTETARGSASPQAAAPRRLRMKRLIALAAALLCGMNWAWAQNVNYNSTYQCGSNTLYLLIDQYAKTAEVVCPEVTWSGTPGYTYHPKPTGVLEIPMSVNFGNIPCTITAIGEKAFMSCSDLTSVSIPSSVTSIRPYAFDGCTSLTSVNIPNSVTSIPGFAFRDCTSLASVTIPSSVTNIGPAAFENCTSLTSVNIPNSVTGIGSGAFENCTSLASWNIPNSVTSIGASAFKNCNPNSSSISISRYVTNLGSEAFAGCGFTTVSLFSNDVVSKEYDDVNQKGFSGIFGDQVTQYTIGNLVTKIGKYAFADCTGLTKLTIPNSVTEIGDYAFEYCTGLTSVTIPSSVTRIPYCGFQYCSGLTRVIIPNTVTTIAFGAFGGCTSLTSVTIPSSVTSIGVDVFTGSTSLTRVIVNSNSVVSMDYNSSTGFKRVFGEQVEHYIIGEGVTSIGQYVFAGSTGLTKVTIPSTVTSINTGAFSNCWDLESIIVLATTPPTVAGYYVFDVYETIPVYVPCGTSAAYQSASGWSYFTNIQDDCPIVFANSKVKEICVEYWDTNEDGELSYSEAAAVTELDGFSSKSDITSFNELQYFVSLTSIGRYEFTNCSNLTSIVLPNSVTSIGSNAFYGCEKLASITIPSSVTSIEGDAFNACSGLAQIVVESGNTVYDSPNNCNAIIETATNTLIAGCKNTVIPSSVTSIGGYAFNGCTGLTSIELPNSVTTIGAYAFWDCPGLTSIELPNSVTTISNYAFWDCPGLTSVVIGNSITTIGDRAFGLCTSLESITVLATTPPTLGSNVFQNVPTNIPVYVPCGSSEAYQIAPLWSAFPNITEECYIEFEDSLVRDICVQNWDTNGDGKLSYAEAEAVADLDYQFYNKGITSFNELQYFTGLTSIINFQFYKCTSLTSITIPSSVTSIEVEAFEGCTGLAEIVVESGNTVYDSRNNCNAIIETATNTLIAGCKNTVIPSSVTSIGRYAFYGCTGLTSIVIPNSVTAIKYAAFSQCTALASIIIPNSVTTIGAWAFENCTGLQSITVLATEPPILGVNSSYATYAFNNVPTNTPVYVPCSSRDAYVAAEGWKEFTNIGGNCHIVFADWQVEEVCADEWGYQGTLSYNDAAAVTSLNGLFTNNNRIHTFDELQYFTGLTYLGEEEFFDCNQLTSITLPEGLTTIYSFAFQYSGLESIFIPANVTEIGTSVFAACNNLETIEVDPNNTTYTSNNGCNIIVKTATMSVVAGCANSNFYEGILEIEEFAFDGETSLTTIVLPSTLEAIKSGAFYSCTNLTSIRVNATTPPTVGYDAFYGVDKNNCQLIVPCGSRDAYVAAYGWSNFTNIQEDCNITLSITGYGNDPTTTEGWHLIASPLWEPINATDVGNLLSNEYDLYKFDGSKEGQEWRNYKNNENNGFHAMYFATGYLYANSKDVELQFVGSTIPSDSENYNRNLYSSDTKFGNWNLVGNSFTTEATVSVTDYYRIEPGTRNLMLSSGNVNPMEGIFVEYNSMLDEVEFTKLTRGERAIESPMVNIDLRNAEGHLLDRARLRMGEGNNMSKLDMLSDPNRLYFRIDGKDYAVARVNGQGEMPLHFDVAENDTYSLNVNVEGMNLSYLHLIDNMTGADVDLLASNGEDAKHSTYTFKAKTTDYASRFRLVFETGSSAEGDSFAFIDAGGNIVINGEGTLQIVDVMGRVVVSVGGHTRCVPTTGIPAGVYVLRLINGDDVKVQKIVID